MWIKRNILDNYFENFLIPQLKENNIEGTPVGMFIFHDGYGKYGGWYETYVHLSHHHEHFSEQDEKQQINLTIYHAHHGYGREVFWYRTYIHLSYHHQHLLYY